MLTCPTCHSEHVLVWSVGSTGYGLLVYVKLYCHDCHGRLGEDYKEPPLQAVPWDAECIDCGCQMLLQESVWSDDEGRKVPRCSDCGHKIEVESGLS